MKAGVSSEKEKVKESQSQSVTPSLDTPSGAGLGCHKVPTKGSSMHFSWLSTRYKRVHTTGFDITDHLSFM